MMNKKYSKNTKDIARKAIGGDDEAMNLLIIELPSGVATDKPNLKTQAKEVAGDDEADGNYGTDDEDKDEDEEYSALLDSIMGSLSDVELDEEQLKAASEAICNALKSGVITVPDTM